MDDPYTGLDDRDRFDPVTRGVYTPFERSFILMDRCCGRGHSKMVEDYVSLIAAHYLYLSGKN